MFTYIVVSYFPIFYNVYMFLFLQLSLNVTLCAEIRQLYKKNVKKKEIMIILLVGM